MDPTRVQSCLQVFKLKVAQIFRSKVIHAAVAQIRLITALCVLLRWIVVQQRLTDEKL